MDITTLLAGPLGGLLGLGGSLLQKWLGMKEAKANHEMKMAELEVMGKIDLQKADIMFRSTVEEKSGEAFKAAIDAQSGLRATSWWAKDFIALFRPGLTLALMISSTGLAMWFNQARPELMEFIIVSQFSLSAVAVGYWFGSRQDDKFRVQSAFKMGGSK
jgi:hypothetical protein